MSGKGQWVDFPKGGLRNRLPGGQHQPFRAECTRCNWKGPVRYDPIIAQADGAAHSNAVHPGLGLKQPGEGAGA